MIKSSVILAAALCLTWLLRKRGAAERHIIWAAAMIAAAILPLLSLVLPSWEPDLAQRVAAALPAVSRTTVTASGPQGANVTFQADAIEPTVFGTAYLLYGLWLGGSLVGLIGLGIGSYRQRRFVSRSHPLADPSLSTLTADVARLLGCTRTIRLRQSPEQSMPMTWGVRRPVVLFPNSVDTWSDERKRVVIAHELAHVHRLDWLVQTSARIACSVYWFNPLFWIASNRLYQESEQACDDAVISLGVDAREYASHLLDIARGLKQAETRWAPTLAMARASTLEKRFAALLRSNLNRRAATRKTVSLVAIATLCVVLPLAAMSLRDAETASTTIEQYTSPPLYSDEARARGVEGVVTVEVRVGVSGNVERLRVVKGLGYGLDENALLAVRDWRFVPARRRGIAVEAITQVDVEFSLRNAELNELIANDMATRIGPGVVPPQVVHRVDPQYSSASKRVQPEGAVVLDAVILEEGAPKILRVIRSLDWELDEIAINALKQWRFSPAMKDGEPVKVRMNIAVSFNAN